MKAELVLALSLVSALGFSQDQSSSMKKDDKAQPINPDRPDLTNGAGITPVGKFLLETGYRQTRTSGTTLHEWGDGPTFRFGANERLEIRFVAPTYALATGGAKGWEDSNLGFKWLLKDGGDGGGFKYPSYAIQAGTSLPSGSMTFRSKQLLPSVTGIVDWDFDRNGDLGCNLGASDQLNASGRPFTLWSASLSFSHSVSGPLSAYFEGYTLVPQAGNGAVRDGGFLYLLCNDCMLDASVGTQLDRHQQSSYIDLGVSIRF